MYLDPVDQAQQKELEDNRRRDDRQQEQINRLETSQAIMIAIMAVNVVASIAQVVECVVVVMRGGAK